MCVCVCVCVSPSSEVAISGTEILSIEPLLSSYTDKEIEQKFNSHSDQFHVGAAQLDQLRWPVWWQLHDDTVDI